MKGIMSESNKNEDEGRQYVIITPAKNEERNLPKLIKSIKEQTIKPGLWIIVDDGSTDDTPQIIKEVVNSNTWIKSIHLPNSPRDVHKHYVNVCNRGFSSAIEFCKKNNINIDYIGVVDADMILEEKFFEKLINEFRKNPKLGIASGGENYYNSKNELVYQDVKDNMPIGCMRLWTLKCFEATGGYYSSYAPDSVSNVIAILKGWDVRLFPQIKGIHLRRTRSAEGLWKGYRLMGVSDYYRNYHPLFVTSKFLKYLYKRPHYFGVAYMYGYAYSALKRIEKINDKQVSDYYYRTKYNEFKRNIPFRK